MRTRRICTSTLPWVRVHQSEKRNFCQPSSQRQHTGCTGRLALDTKKCIAWTFTTGSTISSYTFCQFSLCSKKLFSLSCPVVSTLWATQNRIEHHPTPHRTCQTDFIYLIWLYYMQYLQRAHHNETSIISHILLFLIVKTRIYQMWILLFVFF